MKTIEEHRRSIARTNALLIIFFCLMLGGGGGSVYYYQKSKNAEAQLTITNDSLVMLSANIDTINLMLRKSKLELEKKSYYYDSSIRVFLKDHNSSILNSVVTRSNNAQTLASEYEATGYEKLGEGDLVAAKDFFNQSEKAYNGYHQVYEIWFLLYKNKERLTDPVVKQRLLDRIQKEYSRFGSFKSAGKTN